MLQVDHRKGVPPESGDSGQETGNGDNEHCSE